MANRELIEPNPGDKRHVRRDEEVADAGRSLSQDRQRKAESKT